MFDASVYCLNICQFRQLGIDVIKSECARNNTKSSVQLPEKRTQRRFGNDDSKKFHDTAKHKPAFRISYNFLYKMYVRQSKIP